MSFPVGALGSKNKHHHKNFSCYHLLSINCETQELWYLTESSVPEITVAGLQLRENQLRKDVSFAHSHLPSSHRARLESLGTFQDRL